MQPFSPYVYLAYQRLSLSGNLDTLPSPAPPVLLGPNSLESIGPGYPADPNAAWPKSWLDKYRFVELPGADAEGAWEGEIARLRLGAFHGGQHELRWERVGCFDRGVDWFCDGSLWFLDGPGVS
jgi:hypothetical protein